MVLLTAFVAIVVVPITIGLVGIDVKRHEWDGTDATFWMGAVLVLSLLGFVVPRLLTDLLYIASDFVADVILGGDVDARSQIVIDLTNGITGFVGCLLAIGVYGVGSRYGSRAHTGAVTREEMPTVDTGFGGEISMKKAVLLAAIAGMLSTAIMSFVIGEPLYLIVSNIIGISIGAWMAYNLSMIYGIHSWFEDG